MALIMLKVPFCRALEGYGVFVAKTQQTVISQIFLNDFDNCVNKVYNGIGTDVMQEGRWLH